MISLQVADYCHRCLDFEPEVERPNVIMTHNDEVVSMSDTIVTCENRHRCKNIHDYIQLKFINERNKER